MSEIVYGLLTFAALISVYAIGWIAGYDYKRRHSEIRITDLPKRRLSIPRLGPEEDDE